MTSLSRPVKPPTVTLCQQRVRERYGTVSEEIENRLRYELELIRELELSGYFLIVRDLMEYCRQNRIPAR